MQQISNLEHVEKDSRDNDDIIELKKELKGIGLWGFALYDKGKLILYTKFKSIEYYDFLIALVDSHIGKILAANNTLHYSPLWTDSNQMVSSEVLSFIKS